MMVQKTLPTISAPGWVYIARMGLDVKVGYSKHPIDGFKVGRQRAYRTHNPNRMDLLLHLRGSRDDEARFKELFAPYLIPNTTEWFHLPMGWQDVIRSLYVARQGNEAMGEALVEITRRCRELEHTALWWQLESSIQAVQGFLDGNTLRMALREAKWKTVDPHDEYERRELPVILELLKSAQNALPDREMMARYSAKATERLKASTEYFEKYSVVPDELGEREVSQVRH